MTDARILKRYGCFAQDSPKLSELIACALKHPSTQHTPCFILMKVEEFDGRGYIGAIEILRGIPAPNELVDVCLVTLYASSTNWESTLTKFPLPETQRPYLSFVSGIWNPPLPPNVERTVAIAKSPYGYINMKGVLTYVNADGSKSVFEHTPLEDEFPYMTQHDFIREQEFPTIE